MGDVTLVCVAQLQEGVAMHAAESGVVMPAESLASR